MKNQESMQTNYNPLPPPPPPSPLSIFRKLCGDKFRKKIIIGIAAVVVAIGAAAGIFYWKFLYISDCKGIKDGNDLQNCYIIQTETKKYSFQVDYICRFLVANEKTDECYKKAGIERTNPSFCAKTQSGDNRDECYLSVAKRKIDSAVCGKIENRDFLDSCYKDMAVIQQNPSICDAVSDSSKKDNCYFDVVKTKQNALACDMIYSQDLKEECHFYAVKVLNADILFCVKMKQHKDECYTILAKKVWPMSSCNQIPEEDMSAKRQCFHMIISPSDDPFICEKIESVFFKESCYSEFGMKKGDPSLCDKIRENRTLSDTCYSVTAPIPGQGSVGLCDKIYSIQLRDQCYVSVVLGAGQTKGNISVCNKVQNEALKNICLGVPVGRSLRLISPNEGESLCLGQNLSIKWESKNLRTVSLFIRIREAGNSITYPLGTFPADFNETGTSGSGMFVWKVGETEGGAKLKEGYVYEVVANSSDDGSSISDTSAKVFSILDCRG